MKLVIDIPKKTYNEIKERTIVTCGESFAKKLVKYIKKGTPLPEHHGRLIDSEVLGDYFWDNRSKLFEYKDLQIAIDNAPTIIEGSDSE